MTGKRKALFFDIDGTLLSEKTGEFPESAIQALKEAVKKGHLVFINTGRTICSVPSQLKQLPISGFVCGCGTYVSYGDEVLFSKTIPHERGREIIKVVGESDAGAIMEGQEDCYFPSRLSRFETVESIRRHFKPRGIGIESYLEDEDYDYDKFVMYVDEKTDKDRLLENLRQDLDLIDYGNGAYEAIAKGHSKATAIAFVQQHFGISLEDVYVFGDSANDLPMFEYAIHTVAMAVHSEVLDPYVEFVTRAVEEDGILYAMEHYGIV